MILLNIVRLTHHIHYLLLVFYGSNFALRLFTHLRIELKLNLFVGEIGQIRTIPPPRYLTASRHYDLSGLIDKSMAAALPVGERFMFENQLRGFNTSRVEDFPLEALRRMTTLDDAQALAMKVSFRKIFF